MIARLLLVAAAAGLLLLAAHLLRRWAHRGAALAARREQPGPRVLLFSAPGCATCAAQERALADLGDLVERVDALAERERASAYRVLSVPTTVVVAADGDVTAVHHGLVDADVIRRALTTAA